MDDVGSTVVLRRPRAVWAWQLAVTAGFALFAAHVAIGAGGGETPGFFATWWSDGIEVLAAAGCFLRAALRRDERAAWTVLGVGISAWALGDVVFDAVYDGAPPVPSAADALYLALYPCCYVALALLVRDRVTRLGRSLWLDGLMAALATAALGAAVLFQEVLGSTRGSTSVVVTNLAYPLGDIVLLALVVGVVGLSGWRLDRTWGAIGLGFALLTVADGAYLFQSAAGTYREGTFLDLLWPAGLLLLAMSAWQLPRHAGRVDLEGKPLLVTPIACGLAGTAILVASRFHSLNVLAVALAGATLVTVLVRTALTSRENARVLERMRVQSLTDSLTGLGNRRKLTADLAAALAPGAATRHGVLIVFDLDGFKQYNDSFGHPAGDALLARLAVRLRRAVAPAGCYRLGGDEFCVLADSLPAETGAFLDMTASALSEEGDGFAVTTSFGAAFLPEEAADPISALRLADQRLYAHKQSTLLERSRPQQFLLHALGEHQPGLKEDSGGVADLAVALGRRFDLPTAELEQLRLAAELHDVGKLAIPEAILEKPGPLTEQEWAFVKQHTLIGQRIMAGLPALGEAGRIVRSTHERWDGHGYNDGAIGDEIPLAARIIAVCDAYAAMTRDRPFRPALSGPQALEELRRCAGSQFDPDVVARFCEHLADETDQRHGHPAVRTARPPSVSSGPA